MHKVRGIKTLNLLMLLAFLISFFAVPALISVLHLPEEMLNALALSSQIASAVGAAYAVYMTYRDVEASRGEKLREPFKAIARGLHKARKDVEDNLGKIEVFLKAAEKVPSEAPKLKRLTEISLGDVPIDVVRKDFKLHYKRGLRLLDDIEACNKKIKGYNDKYDELIKSLKKLVEEKLRSRNIGVEPNGLTHVCAPWINDRRRILLYVSPEECRKMFPTTYYILDVGSHMEAVLEGLDKVLGVRESEEELSKELAGLYREIRSSDEFQGLLKDLKRVAESEVKYCLEKLRDELDRVIDDILERYTISGQEIVAKEG